MSDRPALLEQAFSALDRGDVAAFRDLFAPEAKWLGVPGSGPDGATPIWHDRQEVVDLLAQHHGAGRRFEPAEFLEEGPRVAVRLSVTDPRRQGAGETYKVFTFGGSDERAVLLQDCVDRDDALRYLAAD